MYNTYKFNHARECLKFIITEFNIKEINIPYYLCDVIRHSLYDIGCKAIFYHINDDFMPEKEFNIHSYILYPNYFGVFNKNVEKMAYKYPNLIVDNAHAYYNEPKGFACFNSGSKFGYSECAYLWIKNCNKNKHSVNININNKLKIECRNKFLEYDKIYSKTNLLKIDISDNIFPFCYPLLCSSEEEADNIVKNLTSEKKLTVYRYWNSLPKKFNEYKFFSRLVPIPTNIGK